MSDRTDSFDLGRLGLTTGEGRRLDLHVEVDALEFGGQRYAAAGTGVPVRLDVSRTTARGYVLRLRFEVLLEGPCTRCLAEASRALSVDVREIDQPGADDDELVSPYVDRDVLDVRSWARDALVLALPTSIVCREDCLGLCAICGTDLNEAGPDHGHEREPDSRWAKLRELSLE